MNMDAWLANVYGTDGADDLEKTAQHMMLQKLAAEEGVDLSGLNEEQLAALANEVLGAEGQGDEELSADGVEDEGTEVSEMEQQEYLAKEAQAKFEEADFLGRVMAHSYTQELEKIAGVKGGFKAVKHVADAARKVGRGAKRVGNLLAGGGSKEYRPGNHPFSSHSDRKVLKHNAREALKSHAARGGAAAAAGAVGYGAKKHFEKKASAFEKLAELRAAEILQANGIDPSTGAQVESQEGQDFGQALDGRALEILQENGYDTSGIEE